ncbi:MAG: reprolysin-like metallopeptidase, partial [Saprospiraceae bacterium]
MTKAKIFLFFLIFYGQIISAQHWEVIDKKMLSKRGEVDINPNRATYYDVDDDTLKNILWSAPKEDDVNVNASNTVIQIGLPNLQIKAFRIVAYDMMESMLAAKYRDIKTYRGVNVNNPLQHIHIDYTSLGFRASISSPGDDKIYIDHVYREEKTTRVVYYKKDYEESPGWGCSMNERTEAPHQTGGLRMADDCILRSYRLAQATTTQFSSIYGNNLTNIMSAVVTIINRVNQVYESELAVRLVLVNNTDQLFYISPTTGGYSNDGSGTDLTANQSNCTSVIGSSNYDIGHVFGTGNGGVAGLGVVCNLSNKGRGYTGRPNPVGDPFTIDYVCHEIGHQFSGNHTFAGWLGSCGGGNRNNSTAMEPGSGTTIMAYAGICTSTQNVQSNSDPFFHAISLQEIKNYITSTGNSCASLINTYINTPPVISSQSNYTIPISTPFALTLSATDPESNPMTYTWEQMDNVSGDITNSPMSGNLSGPMFRSIGPTASPTRYFPNISTVLSGSLSNTWEVLPSVSRTLNFRGVARDFTGVAGCISKIDLTVSTVSTAGPFMISSQNSATTWLEGQNVSITWDVAGTTANGINCNLVTILLSYDGGLTFPVMLNASTANDGQENIVVPSGITSTARIKVQSVGNIFFDINNTDIIINNGSPSFDVTVNPNALTLCNSQSQSVNVSIQSILGFNSSVTLTTSGFPASISNTISTNTLLPNQNTNIQFAPLNTPDGIYNGLITGASGATVQNKNISISIISLPSTSLVAPANNATEISNQPLLTWTSSTPGSNYEVQVALDASFTTIVLTSSTVNASLQLSNNLNNGTSYFWRVRSTNACGLGSWSGSFTFVTAQCFIYQATDLPISISASGTPTINSYITITDKGTITDLDIVNLMGLHTYISDLRFRIYTPSNTNQIFWNRPCDNEANFNINFDQSAPNSNWPCPPIGGGTYT